MGPAASIDHILQKLSVIFGMVALFNMLIHNFYKVDHVNNKRLPHLPQGWKDLNQINLQCLGKIMELGPNITFWIAFLWSEQTYLQLS